MFRWENAVLRELRNAHQEAAEQRRRAADAEAELSRLKRDWSKARSLYGSLERLLQWYWDVYHQDPVRVEVPEALYPLLLIDVQREWLKCAPLEIHHHWTSVGYTSPLTGKVIPFVAGHEFRIWTQETASETP
ncbi:MAG: hypothetical protein K6V97_06685 [Actinomycetia bacterium]|nr:hypothetical protein [Actinomycetes bacterium]